MRSTAYVTALLQHIFQNADIAVLGDAAGLQNSATEGSLYLSIHTADPAAGGTQSTNEVSYTGYARVAVARNSGGWTVTGNQAKNAALVTFPACTAGSATALYVGIGVSSSGAGLLLYRCALTASRAISAGITPKIDANQITATEYADSPV